MPKEQSVLSGNMKGEASIEESLSVRVGMERLEGQARGLKEAAKGNWTTLFIPETFIKEKHTKWA